MVGALLGAQGAGGGARGFDTKTVAGVMLGSAEVFFEYLPDIQALKCRALVYRFHAEPRPGVLEGFFKEESRGADDAGGGALEYLSETRSLFLTRTYLEPAPGAEFARDVRRLAEASLVWGGDVLARVAADVFHTGEPQ